MERDLPGGRRLWLAVGDIMRVAADAIANAATSALAGDGVDEAIHRAGGAAIMRELDKIRATAGAGALPAPWVFQAVRAGLLGLTEE